MINILKSIEALRLLNDKLMASKQISLNSNNIIVDTVIILKNISENDCHIEVVRLLEYKDILYRMPISIYDYEYDTRNLSKEDYKLNTYDKITNFIVYMHKFKNINISSIDDLKNS